MSTISSFKITEKKNCMKYFCEYLREHEMKINNFKKKKIKLLTKKQQEVSENAKISYICPKKLKINI